MPVEFSTDVIELRLGQIVIAPEDNTRFPTTATGHVKSLAASIKRFRQIQPVIVEIHGPDQYRLVLGFQRCAAIAYLNKTEKTDTLVRAQVVDGLEGKDGRLTAFLTNLHENLDRKAYSPVDLLHSINKFKSDFGWKQNQIAKEFGRSPGWVSDMLRLNKLEEETLQKVHAGEMAVDAALTLAKLDETLRGEVVAEAEVETKAAKAAGKTGSRAGTASISAVKKAARKAAGKAPSKAATKGQGARGSSSITTRSVPSMKEFRENLEENLGPTVNQPVQHFMEFLIEMSFGRGNWADITKAADDVLRLAKDPKAKTEWSVAGKAEDPKPVKIKKAAKKAAVKKASPARKGKK